MALTDIQVKQAKPKNKPYTLKDIQGLSLFIPASGSKRWHFRFTFEGKEGRVSFGTYPQLSLQEARIKCEEARMQIKEGVKPGNKVITLEVEATEADNNGILFKDFAKTWVEFKLKKINAKPSKDKKNKGRNSTEVQILRYMRLDILPALGDKTLQSITRKDLLQLQRKIEAREAYSISEKVRSWLNEIFRYAVASGEIETNPAADLDIAALPYRRNRHYPQIKMSVMPELMAAFTRYQGARQTILGLRLLLLTGVRTAELRFAERWQFDLKKGIWTIPAEDVKQLQKIKKNVDEKVPDYLVPLSGQAIAIVKELLSYYMRGQRYLLTHRSLPSEAISENTLLNALNRMGFKNRLSPHGIRGTISTALNELRYDKDFVEAQLSHAGDNKIRATYNHAEYVEHRRAMMQDWADMLDNWEREGLERFN